MKILRIIVIATCSFATYGICLILFVASFFSIMDRDVFVRGDMYLPIAGITLPVFAIIGSIRVFQKLHKQRCIFTQLIAYSTLSTFISLLCYNPVEYIFLLLFAPFPGLSLNAGIIGYLLEICVFAAIGTYFAPLLAIIIQERHHRNKPI